MIIVMQVMKARGGGDGGVPAVARRPNREEEPVVETKKEK